MTAAGTMTLAAFAQTTQPFIQDDVAFGLNRANPAETVQHVRGPVTTPPSAVNVGSTWSAPFVQSIQFDNNDGFRHAYDGNLLGVNFGTTGAGGSIYNLETRRTPGSTTPGAFQQVFDFATYNAANPAAPLTLSRLAGISASPNNNRIAFTGNDSGNVYVMDYNAGTTPGAGAGVAVTNGRQITALAAGPSNTAGTAWLDNNNLIALSNTGELKKVTIALDGSLSQTVLTVVTLPAGVAAANSSLVYEPTHSPYVFLSASQFAGATSNHLWVLDPSNSFSIVKQIDLSGPNPATGNVLQTAREIAFDSHGNLMIAEFGAGTTTPAGSTIDVLRNAINFTALTDNSSDKYYVQTGTTVISTSFSGVDVAMGMIDYVEDGVNVNVRQRQAVVPYFGGSAPLAQFRSKIASAYAAGTWIGPGIGSSDAAADLDKRTAVGYGDAGELGKIGQQFGGVTVTGPSVLVAYTLFGDANLDRKVDTLDFNSLAANFGKTDQPWSHADFNYDGKVDTLDFNFLAANFGRTISGDAVAGGTLVPEPASVGMISIAAATMIRRRRRA
jgi:hypothetical protein